MFVGSWTLFTPKYKEKHYHDPLNLGDGVEQPLSICFSKSCDKPVMVNNRSYMYGVPVDIHFHELNNQKSIWVISI
jgi:hypothetical protein